MNMQKWHDAQARNLALRIGETRRCING